MSNNKADVNNLGRNIVLYNLDENNINDFYQQNSWIDRKSFTRICHLYEFPEKSITVVIQNYYIDAAYGHVIVKGLRYFKIVIVQMNFGIIKRRVRESFKKIFWERLLFAHPTHIMRRGIHMAGHF